MQQVIDVLANIKDNSNNHKGTNHEEKSPNEFFNDVLDRLINEWVSSKTIKIISTNMSYGVDDELIDKSVLFYSIMYEENNHLIN